MGKTEKGAIWLDNKLLSSYDYWQFWRNTDDRDVIKFLKMFTDLDLNRINKIKNENINKIKIILANEATSLLHGKAAAAKAEKTAKNIFEKGSIGDDLPVINLNTNDVSNGLNIVDLVVTAKLLSSKNEVRRAIKNKGIKLNNVTIEDDKLKISIDSFDNNETLKLSHGKKKHVILKLI